MVINRFRRYRIQVPLNIWAEIPFNLTHVRYLQFKQWGELNQKPSPISRLFPHLEAIQNHTKYQKKLACRVYFTPLSPLFRCLNPLFDRWIPMKSSPAAGCFCRWGQSRCPPSQCCVDVEAAGVDPLKTELTTLQCHKKRGIHENHPIFYGAFNGKNAMKPKILLDLPACYFLSTSHVGILTQSLKWESQLQNMDLDMGCHSTSLFHDVAIFKHLCYLDLPDTTNPSPTRQLSLFWCDPTRWIPRPHCLQRSSRQMPDLAAQQIQQLSSSAQLISKFSRSSHSFFSTPDKLEPWFIPYINCGG